MALAGTTRDESLSKSFVLVLSEAVLVLVIALVLVVFPDYDKRLPLDRLGAGIVLSLSKHDYAHPSSVAVPSEQTKMLLRRVDEHEHEG